MASHSFSIRHSSSTGPREEGPLLVREGLRPEGEETLPFRPAQNGSASHQTLPASSAIRSVSPMRGSALRDDRQ